MCVIVQEILLAEVAHVMPEIQGHPNGSQRKSQMENVAEKETRMSSFPSW
jgi:hypothetical protein